MFDIVIYFFRRKKLFFYSGLLLLALDYSYILALYFLDLSPFEKKMFYLFIAFSMLWIVLCYKSFSKNREKYLQDREKEKYDLLREQITSRYKLDIKDNIFSKIDLIISILRDKFSSKGLFSIRVLKVVNSSLSMYIENLKIKDELNKALLLSSSPDKREFYQSEITKNNQQNSNIEEKLDNFIKELVSKNSNDKKIDNLLDELEDSIQIVKKIK